MKKLILILILLAPAFGKTQSVLNSNSVNPFALRDIVGAYSKSQSYFVNKPVDLFLPTSVYINSGAAVSHDISVMSVPTNACSTFDGSICYRISDFYKPTAPQAIISGYYFYNKNDAIILGLNTGYNSSKLIIQPSIALGYSSRIELDKSKQFVIEGTRWFGGSIQHKPCVDLCGSEFNKKNLSSWSDFHYQSTINSYSMRVMYQWKF
jgi:hypothetical protein